ncbi:hypothetical protein REH65_01665 [Saccharopolyspora sp. ID03-671]|uniref:hypothetical protein n=1 Tax=Saccharopolyspora sp. ID03-671 TaxID=3073066 RepID=UPI00324FCFDD
MSCESRSRRELRETDSAEPGRRWMAERRPGGTTSGLTSFVRIQPVSEAWVDVFATARLREQATSGHRQQVAA